MQIESLYPGGYAANCYLVTVQNAAVLIDCTAPAANVLEALKRHGATLRAILLTHGHFDHMLTVEEVAAATGAPVFLANGDRDLPPDGKKNAFAVFFGYGKAYPEADVLFEAGEVLSFGGLSVSTQGTPGHTHGSVVYLIGDVAFTGDTLFANGYGRYDLYGGDGDALLKSLKALAALPKGTVIYPGHGESATLSTALAKLSID